MPSITVTLEEAATVNIEYQYGGDHQKPGEPFVAIDRDTGHVWTRDTGDAILRLIRQITKCKRTGKPIPTNNNSRS